MPAAAEVLAIGGMELPADSERDGRNEPHDSDADMMGDDIAAEHA